MRTAAKHPHITTVSSPENRMYNCTWVEASGQARAHGMHTSLCAEHMHDQSRSISAAFAWACPNQ